MCAATIQPEDEANANELFASLEEAGLPRDVVNEYIRRYLHNNEVEQVFANDLARRECLPTAIEEIKEACTNLGVAFLMDVNPIVQVEAPVELLPEFETAQS